MTDDPVFGPRLARAVTDRPSLTPGRPVCVNTLRYAEEDEPEEGTYENEVGIAAAEEVAGQEEDDRE